MTTDAGKGQDLVPLLAGEIRRLLDYPGKGYCLSTELPPAVLAAHQRLEVFLAFQ
jgi:hypothetical protein